MQHYTVLSVTLADDVPGSKAGSKLKNLATAGSNYFSFFEKYKIWCQKDGCPIRPLTQTEQDKKKISLIFSHQHK